MSLSFSISVLLMTCDKELRKTDANKRISSGADEVNDDTKNV